jgi:hypothetical protein
MLFYDLQPERVENPSCLHATLASEVDQKPSHTVPQVSFQHTSNRPSRFVLPPTKRSSPFSQITTWIRNKNYDLACLLVHWAYLYLQGHHMLIKKEVPKQKMKGNESNIIHTLSPCIDSPATEGATQTFQHSA